jgi:hypothetical protein
MPARGRSPGRSPASRSPLDALRLQLTESAAGRLAGLRVPARDDEWGPFTDRLVREAIAFQVEQYDLHELVRLPHRHGGSGRHGPLVDRLREIIAAGVAAGCYEASDPPSTAALVYDLLHAAGDRVCQEPDGCEAIAAAASELLRRALLRAGA